MGSPKVLTRRWANVRAAATVICWPQHRAHGQFVAIHRARHAQAITVRETVVQGGVDGVRVGVQIKRSAHPADDQRQHLAQRVADLQHQLAPHGVEVGDQPARVYFAARFDAKCPSSPFVFCVSRCEFDSGHGAFADERQHRIHVIGWPVAQLDGDALPIRWRARSAQLRGVELVVRHKRRVKPAHAGKATGQCDLGDGQVGVGQQLLGG